MREDFLSRLTPEAKECFFFTDDKGHSYSDLMKVSKKEIGDIVKEMRSKAQDDTISASENETP